MIKNKFCFALVGFLFLNLHLSHASLSDDETQIIMDKTHKHVTITKGSIHLNSVSKADFEDFQDLWSNPDVMKWIGKGSTKSKEQSSKLFWAFEQCWETSFKKNIFSFNMLFSIKIKEPEQEHPSFIGYVNLFTPHDKDWVINNEGRTELGIGILPKFQGKGQGRQAVEVIVNHYIPYLNENRFLVAGNLIQSVEATCKTDNVYVNVALKKACGEPILLTDTPYGQARNFYKLSLNQTS